MHPEKRLALWSNGIYGRRKYFIKEFLLYLEKFMLYPNESEMAFFFFFAKNVHMFSDALAEQEH